MGMFRDKKPPDTPQYFAPPPPPEILDVIDENAGIQFITVTRPDGKKVRKIERLPRTPEQEALFKQGEQMFSSAVKNMIDLYQYNPDAVAPFKNLIDVFAQINDETAEAYSQIADLGNIKEEIQTFRTMKRAMDDEDFAAQRRGLEENLARKGWSNSTPGQEARALAARNEKFVRDRSEYEALQFGEDLASHRLNRNAQAFGLGEIGRNKRLQAAQTEYDLNRQHLDDVESRRQTAIAENLNLAKVGAGITGQDFDRAMASRAPEIADRTFQMQSADSLARYDAGVRAQFGAYDRARHAYDNRPPRFRDLALQAGGAFIGRGLSSGMGAMGRVY